MKLGNEETLQRIKGGLIVSCQALPEEPLHSSFIMGRMALAASQAGAVGIRANTVADIKEIRNMVDLPIIGIIKKVYDDCPDVYITPTIAEVDALTACGVEKVKALLQQYGMEITCFNVPFHPVQVSEEEFASRMEALPAQAKAMSQVGCSRSIIWIIPGSDTLPYEENYALHVRRLSQVARVYGEYGIRLGLEFIGPYTARKNSKYPFLYTAEKMLELARDCGENVGLLFDSWHWFTGDS